MAEYTIFYSWQSDSDPELNWKFIEEALKEAANKVRAAPETEDIPVIDFGMLREPGSPEVATIMFKKIAAAAIFVADVTAVGRIQLYGGGEKKAPNPNVMMELGYAAGKIGWERIVCVMNEDEQFGSIEDMPIDVRNRRFPIRYKLQGADPASVYKELVSDLRRAIEAVVYSDYQSLIEAERRLDANCLHVIQFFHERPCFHTQVTEPQPGVTFVGSMGGVATSVLNAAIPRLLDLRLIYCHFDSRQHLYAYHWTYLGRMYIELKWPGTQLPPLQDHAP
ncbi:MAG TPA: hypothetical protein VM165_17635 [Planctomycetaceae bacterium]|nr:hypothetical protein [Planctomycetaceae bacterium]